MHACERNWGALGSANKKRGVLGSGSPSREEKSHFRYELKGRNAFTESRRGEGAIVCVCVCVRARTCASVLRGLGALLRKRNSEVGRGLTLQVGHHEAIARVRVHGAPLTGRKTLIEQKTNNVHVKAVNCVQQRVARVLPRKTQGQASCCGLPGPSSSLRVTLNTGFYQSLHRWGHGLWRIESHFH